MARGGNRTPFSARVRALQAESELAADDERSYVDQVVIVQREPGKQAVDREWQYTNGHKCESLFFVRIMADA